MRLRRAIPWVVAAAVAVLLCAPSALRAGDDWLPISPADLALKDNPAQPGAHAMILYRESTIDAKHANTDGDSVSEYIRIKIFTQEGAKEADREIEFVKAESDVKDIRARTIRPDGSIANFDGKVFEKTVVKVSGVKFLAKAFTLPDVQPGCIIEYKYRIQNKPEYLHDEHWTLSGTLFTREAHFSIIPYVRADSYPLFYRQFGLPVGTVPQRQANGSYTMVAHDILAIEDEAFMPPHRAIEARVDFYYRDLNEPTNESVEHFWSRIGKKMDDNFEGFINKKGALEKELARIVSPSDSPEVKLQKICARVREIRDLGYEEQKSQKELKKENLKDNSNVEDVLKHGYGNGRQIDFLFVGLARAAGFDATEVYIAERNNNIFMPQLEDPGELNDDIVWVRAAGKEYWVDPAARFYPFGLLPWYETSTRGLRLNKQGGEFVDVPPSSSSDASIIRHAELEMSEEGAVTGKLQVDFTGHQAAVLRADNHATDETGRKKAITDHIKEWLPAGSGFEIITLANWDNASVPLHVEGNVAVPNFGSTVGRRILVPLTLFQSTDVKAFQSARRTNAVYFHFPYQETDEIKIHPPAGYRIDSVPAAKEHKPGIVSYKISAEQQGSTFVVHRYLDVNGIVFTRDMYRPLQAFFNSVKTDDEAQASLQRSESAKN